MEIRTFTWDDLPALTEVSGAKISEDDLRHLLKTPGVEPETNCLIAVNDDGRIVGFTFPVFEAENRQVWLRGNVHPDYRRQGIGTQLIRALEAQIRRPELVCIRAFINENHADRIALYESLGYVHVRTGQDMTILLHNFSQPCPMPPGFEIRPFDPVRDARTLYQVDQTAFREHWGYAGDSFEKWSHEFLENGLFDPALWVVAYAGEEIAGFCCARGKDRDEPMVGWIDTLAVLHQWRRRGLGEALLKQSFYLLQRCGYMQADLGVDAENTTNAVALYERVGMRVKARSLIYETRFVS
ncbi:MAG TPA: GNAT family N-acetyltransferase [Aggregatilineaceae bacterium]|nr:GNAT family N-acetyltransferase [Aggregatilineaceae bacterium]